jgi:hypothetical protein
LRVARRGSNGDATKPTFGATNPVRMGVEHRPPHCAYIGLHSWTQFSPAGSVSLQFSSRTVRWPRKSRSTPAALAVHRSLIDGPPQPFAPDDPVYGAPWPAKPALLYLGRPEAQCERGLLAFPASMMIRLRHNPFYGPMANGIDGFVAARRRGQPADAKKKSVIRAI